MTQTIYSWDSSKFKVDVNEVSASMQSFKRLNELWNGSQNKENWSVLAANLTAMWVRRDSRLFKVNMRQTRRKWRHNYSNTSYHHIDFHFVGKLLLPPSSSSCCMMGGRRKTEAEAAQVIIPRNIPFSNIPNYIPYFLPGESRFSFILAKILLAVKKSQ